MRYGCLVVMRKAREKGFNTVVELADALPHLSRATVARYWYARAQRINVYVLHEIGQVLGVPWYELWEFH